MFKWRDGSVTPVGVIECMRSEIQNMVVHGVMDLGYPDYNILPKKEKETLESL